MTRVSSKCGDLQGPDPQNFPCRRPPNTNPKLFEFQRYLKVTGIIQALSEAFAKLSVQKPRPMDPLQFIIEQMVEQGRATTSNDGVVLLQDELTELQALLDDATAEHNRLLKILDDESGKMNLIVLPEEFDGERNGE